MFESIQDPLVATSTSSTGMHFGHYKVLIASHSFSSTADDADEK